MGLDMMGGTVPCPGVVASLNISGLNTLPPDGAGLVGVAVLNSHGQSGHLARFLSPPQRHTGTRIGSVLYRDHRIIRKHFSAEMTAGHPASSLCLHLWVASGSLSKCPPPSNTDNRERAHFGHSKEKSKQNITRDVEIKNNLTRARGEGEGDSGERGFQELL